MRTLLRVALFAVAVSALFPGLQATLGPESFYTGFPSAAAGSSCCRPTTST